MVLIMSNQCKHIDNLGNCLNEECTYPNCDNVCKYVVKEGESCRLNNNCKYPDCNQIFQQLKDIVCEKP